MSSMRFLIMSWLFLAGVIGSGLIGPNRSAVLQEYGLSETQFGAGVASVQIVAATAVLAGAHWLARLRPVVDEATLRWPADSAFLSTGKQGLHSEHLDYLLTEMQSVARAHPEASW